jgi:putative ABC transport system permease protein
MEQFINQQTDMVSNNMFGTFLLLKPGSDVQKLEAKFPAFVDKYLGTGLKAAGFYKKQFLVAVKDLHLYTGMSNDISTSGTVSKTYLYILGSIALFTLLIACINFMNLSTARSSKRSAEVGVRKVLGARRRSLVNQFMGESLLMSMIAFLIALGITQLLLPAFSHISGKNLSFHLSQQWFILVGFLILSIITGLLAGTYPAFLSFIISAGKSFERQAYQFPLSHCIKKRVGHISIYHFRCPDHRFRCYYEPDELFALNGSWVRKRPANSDTIEKHDRKKCLRITKE